MFLGDAAEEICSIWRQVLECRSRGEVSPCVIDLCNVRIQGLARNDWHGESLTRIRTLMSIDGVGPEGGTTVKVLPEATTASLTKVSTLAIPSSDCCVSAFRNLRNKLSPPFRLSVKGKVTDAQPLEMSQGGNPKRVFDLVDHSGVYFTCCAMEHNAESAAIHNFQEVVLYFGTGRKPIGTSKGMLYLLKDAVIISVGQPNLLSTAKTEELLIE